MGPQRRRPLTRAEAEYRLRNMALVRSPAERDALIAVWTADPRSLPYQIRASDPILARVAIQEAKDRAASEPALIAALVERLTRTPEALQAAAALVLGSWRERRAVPVLRRLVATGPPATALPATAHLIAFRDTAAYPTIRALTGRLSDTDKRHMADLLAQLGDPASRQLVRGLLKNPYAGTRAHAVRALGTLHDRKSVPALIAALTDPYADVREAAAWSLATIGDRRALAPLRAAQHRGNSPHVPAHSARKAQEMAQRATLALQRGQPLPWR